MISNLPTLETGPISNPLNNNILVLSSFILVEIRLLASCLAIMTAQSIETNQMLHLEVIRAICAITVGRLTYERFNGPPIVVGPCFVMRYLVSSFAVILTRKRELVALL